MGLSGRINILLLSVVLLICALQPAIAGGPVFDCSKYAVEYLGRSYDPSLDRTTFSYMITVLSGTYALNHWMLELGPCIGSNDFVSSTPAGATFVDPDPATGTRGLKFDGVISPGESQIFSIVFNGEFGEGPTQVVIMAGGEYSTEHCNRPSTGPVTKSCRITAQPQDQEACPGGSATFSVTASGSGLSYQWQKEVNGAFVNINNELEHITGADSSTLIIDRVDPDDAGTYEVIVSSQCGCYAVSRPAKLVLDCKPNMISVKAIPDDPCVGTDVTVFVSVSDVQCDMESVVLVYDGLEHPAQLESGDLCSGTWTGTIPSPAVPLELDFYVLVRTSLGNEARSPADQSYYHVAWRACNDPPVMKVVKTASSSEVAPGGTVTYTITYANEGSSDLDGVLITESYPQGATFVSASPAPDSGADNLWTVGFLPAGYSGTIIVTLRAPEDPNFRFNFEQGARGEGFVRTYKEMSTGLEDWVILNRVSMTAKTASGQKSVQTTSSVAISGQAGTRTSMRESGSGSYSREELLYVYKENRSIRDVSSLSASYHPTMFDLPRRPVNYSSTWTERECSRNYLTSESASEEYRYATKIERDSLFSTDRNGTNIALETSFEGVRHTGYAKLSVPDDKGHRETVKKFSSDFAGSFKIKEMLGTTFSNRSNAITDVKHYDEPHVTIYQASEPDRTDENNINYTISVLNDGNRALGPIYLRDVFPTGTFFFDASTKPSAPDEAELIDSPYANWTFTYLPAGKSITIYLRVKIYQVIDVPVNWVYVAAGYDGQWVVASNPLASNFNYLSCAPSEVCKKTSSGWNPPDWGFDRSEDICGSCVSRLPEDDGPSYCPSCRVGG